VDRQTTEITGTGRKARWTLRRWRAFLHRAALARLEAPFEQADDRKPSVISRMTSATLEG
jgi:hypothetical protein